MTPEEEIATLKAENAALRAQLTAVVARVQELEARAAKDSHTSSKPPSSDGLKRRTKSLRKPSGKKAGGQLGHRGETLHLVAAPDELVEQRPAICAHCQTPLADADVVLRERRQVHELPAVRLRSTEYQALHVRCPVCQAVSVGAFPAAAPSRAQYGPQLRALAVYLVEEQLLPLGRVQRLLADLLGVRLGRGTLVRWIGQAAVTLGPVEAELTVALRQAPVLHSDETGVRRAGKLAWAQVASTSRLTRYAVHAKRGREATDAMGILPGYAGVSVHDGWTTYRTYTACRHALCNIHHLRELTFLEEQYQQAWATQMKTLLLEMKTATEQARADGLAPTACHHLRGVRHALPGRARLRPRGQSAARAAPPPARTRQAVTSAEPARTALDETGGGAGLPRRPHHSLRQQPS